MTVINSDVGSVSYQASVFSTNIKFLIGSQENEIVTYPGFFAKKNMKLF